MSDVNKTNAPEFPAQAERVSLTPVLSPIKPLTVEEMAEIVRRMQAAAAVVDPQDGEK